jgi:hypothetical protein
MEMQREIAASLAEGEGNGAPESDSTAGDQSVFPYQIHISTSFQKRQTTLT